jgi:hypothetical protein
MLWLVKVPPAAQLLMLLTAIRQLALLQHLMMSSAADANSSWNCTTTAQRLREHANCQFAVQCT